METNVIYNEDCLDGMANLPDGSIDLIVTDPPYLINYKTNRRKNNDHKFCKTILNDNNEEVVESYVKQCSRVLKDDTAFYCFTNSDTIDFFKQLVGKYFNIKNIIVWVKNSHTAGDLKAQYGKKYEMIIYANKGRCEINGKRLTDVWEYDRVVGNKQVHQNQKPLGLIKTCIKKSSNEGDLVLDGFMGSATTAVACLKTGRKFIGWEQDEDYYHTAIKRVGKFDKQYYEELPDEKKPNQEQLF